MKSVTIREAQHNLAKILKAVEGGETVEIVRRKVPVARLSPAPSAAAARTDWEDHGERLAAVWGRPGLTQSTKHSTISGGHGDGALF